MARLERTRHIDVARALLTWERTFARRPHWAWDLDRRCEIPECCPDPDELRRTLLTAAAQLPPRDARAFRERLRALGGFDLADSCGASIEVQVDSPRSSRTWASSVGAHSSRAQPAGAADLTILSPNALTCDPVPPTGFEPALNRF
ncbi:hypothetical protein GCM10022380_45880 [Amycolatopsis tucumanensis]|uniref:Uncharacterized protein n=1 Tax=Amycolatopsis tucumanensis TaxID=401106 RepID=A0ABP7IM05_9PSEU